jgi:hypothetical protein
LAEAFLLCELMEHRHTSQANIQELQSLSPLVSLSALERAFQCILRAERLVKPHGSEARLARRAAVTSAERSPLKRSFQAVWSEATE